MGLTFGSPLRLHRPSRGADQAGDGDGVEVRLMDDAPGNGLIRRQRVR
jgi:hypothetical protein